MMFRETEYKRKSEVVERPTRPSCSERRYYVAEQWESTEEKVSVLLKREARMS